MGKGPPFKTNLARRLSHDEQQISNSPKLRFTEELQSLIGRKSAFAINPRKTPHNEALNANKFRDQRLTAATA